MSSPSFSPTPTTSSPLSSQITSQVLTSASAFPGPPGNRTEGGDGRRGGAPADITANARLYLYTFLATLILLLGVSVAIVTRSVVLRRRQRRLIAEAIANGTYIPPSPSNPNSRSRRGVDLSKKPKLWNVGVYNTENRNLLVWDFQPLALQNLIPCTYPPPQPPLPPPRQSPRTRLLSLLHRRTLTPPSTPTPPPPPEPIHIEKVQVGAMILMPSPTPFHPKLRDDEDQEVPLLEMGVLSVQVRKGEEGQ